jgi:hypothetical protein
MSLSGCANLGFLSQNQHAVSAFVFMSICPAKVGTGKPEMQKVMLTRDVLKSCWESRCGDLEVLYGAGPLMDMLRFRHLWLAPQKVRTVASTT